MPTDSGEETRGEKPVALHPGSLLSPELQTTLLAVVLTDLHGFLQSQDTLGNACVQQMLNTYRTACRRLIEKNGGHPIDGEGDSANAVFRAPSDAILFALDLQAWARNARVKGNFVYTLRVAVHAGEVLVKPEEEPGPFLRVDGLALSLCGRIRDLAQPNQILCSAAVFDDARIVLDDRQHHDRRQLEWLCHGSYSFKGTTEQIIICEVGERGNAFMAPPPRSSKGWPSTNLEEEPGWRPAVGIPVPNTNWILVRRIGQGGFGEVWLAENTGSRKRLAFKFCFNRERITALKREARLLKDLPRHPAIVPFHDVCAEPIEGPHYLTMDYIEGPSMAEWLLQDPPLHERILAMAQIADALACIHERQIYHRDIKPSNILLESTSGGRVKARLSDFSLGITDNPDLLGSAADARTELAGTWDFMAPEVRQNGKSSPQSDLFSLGVTMYRIFRGDLEGALGDWQAYIPQTGLRRIIAKCLRDLPRERWKSAKQLAAALRFQALVAPRQRILTTLAAALFAAMLLSLFATFNNSLYSERFIVKKILVEGLQTIPEQQILAAAGITPGTAIWDIDPIQIQERIRQANPSIIACETKRFFPNTVRLILQESPLMAAFQYAGQSYAIDLQGNIMPAPHKDVIRALPQLELDNLSPTLQNSPADTPGQTPAMKLDQSPVKETLAVLLAYGRIPMADEVRVESIRHAGDNGVATLLAGLSCEIRWRPQDARAEAANLYSLWIHVNKQLPYREYIDLRFSDKIACK